MPSFSFIGFDLGEISNFHFCVKKRRKYHLKKWKKDGTHAPLRYGGSLPSGNSDSEEEAAEEEAAAEEEEQVNYTGVFQHPLAM